MDAANYWHDKYQELKEVVGIDADEIRQLRARVKELEARVTEYKALQALHDTELEMQCAITAANQKKQTEDACAARIAELEARKVHVDSEATRICIERDRFHDWADRLANAIAAHMGEEIGEHTNLNNPWANALEAIDGQRCR